MGQVVEAKSKPQSSKPVSESGSVIPPSAPTPTPAVQGRLKRIVKRSSGSIGTPSIKKALRGEFADDEKQISAKEQFQIYSKAEETEPFTKEQLKEKWNAFLPRLNDRPSLKATLSTLPDIQEDFTLLLAIESRIQDELLVNVKPELISWLRKELRNSKINLKTVIREIKREKMFYSDMEKFREMASKNPNLAMLKKNLNLDF